MWIYTGWFVLLLFLQYHVTVSSDEDEFFLCCRSEQLTNHTDWFFLGGRGWFDNIETVCKDNITTNRNKDYIFSGIWLVDFRPKNEFGILGVSFCENVKLENCYVVEIFGLVSGRLGYFWRRHSRNETGNELWVPGKKEKLPSTLLKSDTVVREGTWDREGRTLYQFYVETRENDDRVRIRYNGGTARQQKEMVFTVPYQKIQMAVASYYNDSYVAVHGAIGCSIFHRMNFEPGQHISIFWIKPLGAFGLSLCTDSGQYDCYVFEFFGFGNKGKSYFWRKHSLFEEGGKKGWVPGLETRLSGTVLAQGENEHQFMDDAAWKYAEYGMHIFIKRALDEKLEVRVLGHVPYTVYPNSADFTLDIPNNFQYTTVGSRAIVSGKEVNPDNISLQGPCFNSGKLGKVTQTCKQQVPPQDPSWPEHKPFDIFSPRPGVAEADVVSNVLKSKAVRKNLCVFLHGMVSHKGGSIIVTAEDASGTSNESVYVGKLTYNNVYPPEWQRVRLSVDLPFSLQNVSLKVKLTSKRPTPDSFVLLHTAKLCSYDGCGLPTAKGTPYIAFGKSTYPARFPWHVAIFKTHNETYKEYICGGTLIRSDAVLSAAHCFSDDQGKLEDKEKFKLAVGKKYNFLYVYEPYQQFSDAFDIRVPSRYNGDLSHFIQDIALIRVNFSIHSLVLPACLDWFEHSLPSLQPNNVGQVAGWGVHEGNVESRELYFADLPYISYDQCIKAIPKTFVGFVTPDKFCAGNINGSTVRRGDSGGGLVFEKRGLWYLRGVVSTGVPDQLTYTTFTDVAYYMPWIREVLNITKSDY